MDFSPQHVESLKLYELPITFIASTSVSDDHHDSNVIAVFNVVQQRIIMCTYGMLRTEVRAPWMHQHHVIIVSINKETLWQAEPEGLFGDPATNNSEDRGTKVLAEEAATSCACQG